MRRLRVYFNSPLIDFFTNNPSFNKYPWSIYHRRESNGEHETSKISCNTDRKRRRAMGKKDKKKKKTKKIQGRNNWFLFEGNRSRVVSSSLELDIHRVWIQKGGGKCLSDRSHCTEIKRWGWGGVYWVQQAWLGQGYIKRIHGRNICRNIWGTIVDKDHVDL